MTELFSTRLLTCLALLLGLFGWHSWQATRMEQVRQMQSVLHVSKTALDRYFTQLQAGLAALAQDLVAPKLAREPAFRHFFSSLDASTRMDLGRPLLGPSPGSGSSRFVMCCATIRGRCWASSCPPCPWISCRPSGVAHP